MIQLFDIQIFTFCLIVCKYLNNTINYLSISAKNWINVSLFRDLVNLKFDGLVVRKDFLRNSDKYLGGIDDGQRIMSDTLKHGLLNLINKEVISKSSDCKFDIELPNGAFFG